MVFGQKEFTDKNMKNKKNWSTQNNIHTWQNLGHALSTWHMDEIEGCRMTQIRFGFQTYLFYAKTKYIIRNSGRGYYYFVGQITYYLLIGRGYY